MPKHFIFLFSACFLTLAGLNAQNQEKKNRVEEPVECVQFSKPTDNTLKKRNSLSLFWQKKGYLLAFTDSTGPVTACIQKGRLFDSLYLVQTTIENADTVLKSAKDLANLGEQWLTQMENTGYPFAKVRYEILREEGNKLWMKRYADHGNFYNLDSISFGLVPLSKGFLKWAAKVKVGSAYNQSALDLLSLRLAGIEGFAQAPKSADLFVGNGRLVGKVPLYKLSHDQLSGLLGLATNPSGKTLLTGEASGKFYNMFKAGVSAQFDWKSFKARSQEIAIRTSVPYIIGAPFITILNLGFEKYDTFYTIFNRGAQFRFPSGSHSAFTVGFLFTNRTRIFADEATVRNFRHLPDNPSSKNELFQLGYDYSNLILGAIPKKGIKFHFMGHGGFRSYIRDARLAAITWTSSLGNQENVYDSLQRTGHFRSPQYKLEYEISGYQPLSRFLVLKLSAVGSNYYAPVIYFNELGRFGGIKNMRGFNEQSIFANQMNMAVCELHLLLGENGYIGPFYNAAFYRNQSQNLNGLASSGFLQGLGFLGAVRTQAGVLQLVWALGKSSTQPFVLNNSKFHFGLSTTF